MKRLIFFLCLFLFISSIINSQSKDDSIKGDSKINKDIYENKLSEFILRMK